MRRQTVTLLGWGLAGGVATAVLFGVGALIVAAVDDDPDPVACKQAMRRQFVEGARGDGGGSVRPPECEGIDDATAERLAAEVMREVLGEVVEERAKDAG